MRMMKENRVDMLFFGFMQSPPIVIPKKYYNIIIAYSVHHYNNWVSYGMVYQAICQNHRHFSNNEANSQEDHFYTDITRTFKDTYDERTTYSFLSTEANHDRYEYIVI